MRRNVAFLEVRRDSDVGILDAVDHVVSAIVVRDIRDVGTACVGPYWRI